MIWCHSTEIQVAALQAIKSFVDVCAGQLSPTGFAVIGIEALRLVIAHLTKVASDSSKACKPSYEIRAPLLFVEVNECYK